MSNLLLATVSKIKSQNFGLGNKVVRAHTSLFGFPLNWTVASACSFKFKPRNGFSKGAALWAERALKDEVVDRPLGYNSSLQKRVGRRIALLKLNRSWRGVRHSASLPVRGQRTKTNARTRKSRRR